MLNIKPVNVKLSATRAYGNNRYIAYSSKLEREVVLYSNLEYYCFLLLEFNNDVVFYCEQPDLNISRVIDGKVINSIVDFITIDSEETTIIECKPSSELDNPKVIRQIQIQKEWSFSNNIKHKIFTEKSVKNQKILLSNLKILHTALKQYSLEEQLTKESILSFIKSQKRQDIQTIILNSYNITERNVLPILSKLFHEGKIMLDIDKSNISLKTEVFINERKDKNV
ncbi:TnsA endonuclease N-terminal domain-containing protein [Streptococcus pluranimalium]|uniref:TnsA endonuclease N-terminal domain-containing protein n=1 Tax=Streptococcus pluranimalium TaxID=82348 RepID=UPI003F6939B2